MSNEPRGVRTADGRVDLFLGNERLVVVRNGSPLLVYDVLVWQDYEDTPPVVRSLPTVPPQEGRKVSGGEFLGEVGDTVFILEFTDAAGRRWRRMPNGLLIEQSKRTQRKNPAPLDTQVMS
ncbi:hypothetical protein [Kribbella sp. VKM Ac-2568]|uniref:hypothetical protein n=1 Tax=Kribbella sp. VKM Ac-2568 TaxID=2512219 RepID=UPI00104A991A|nr:hypothetical protein [Kribbella sp. VKM Ac-2568]